MYPPPHIITQFWVFVLGCLLGTTVGVAVFEGSFGGAWATFAGAGAGAVVTVLGVTWVESRKTQHERIRKQRAALFPLAEALSEICGYAEEGMAYLIRLGGERRSAFERELPREVLGALKDVAEWFDGDPGKAAAAIGPKYQLCRARSRADHDLYYRITVICDFAELYALASRLFDLSRGGNEPIATGALRREEIDAAIFGPERYILSWRDRPDVQRRLDEKYGVRIRH